jgi:hypothetical protein
MARRTWEQLSPAYQARLRKQGIGPEEHASGVPLHKARGKQSPQAEAEQRKWYRHINKFANRFARYYGVDADDVKDAVKELGKPEAQRALALQERMEELYHEGRQEEARQLWESRDRSLPDWMFFYHGAFS